MPPHTRARYKSTSVNVETILHYINQCKQGATTPDIREALSIPDGFDLGNKIYSVAVNGYVEKKKSGNATSHNIYHITKLGKKLLTQKPHRVQVPEDIVYTPMGEGNASKSPNKPSSQRSLEIIPPAPVYSPTAQEAMNLLSQIIDANEQARKSLESVFMTVDNYFTSNPLDNLPADAGPFKGVIEEMQSFRDILESVRTITEPEQGNDVNEPSQESLIG